MRIHGALQGMRFKKELTGEGHAPLEIVRQLAPRRRNAEGAVDEEEKCNGPAGHAGQPRGMPHRAVDGLDWTL